YENRGRQIEGLLNGEIFAESSTINWELEIDVQDHPVIGRGSFDWSTGLIDIAGEMDLSHELGQAIWDILNEEPLFDWNAGRVQTAFHFDGENYRYQSGQAHVVMNGVGVGFENLAISDCDHVASILWTPGYFTFDFNGNGVLSKLVDAPFDWQGSLSIEPGPNLQFELSEASIAPEWPFGTIQLTHEASNETPLEVSILNENAGFDFQVLGLDLLLSSEMGEHLTSSTMDLMLNGRWQNQTLVNSTADVWLRDGILITPMFQAEVGEGLFNAGFVEPIDAKELIAAIISNPEQFITSASLSKATLFRFSDVIGKDIILDWTPGQATPLKAQGDFFSIGYTEVVFEPEPGSTLRKSSGVLKVSPGDFSMDYQLDLDPAAELKAKIVLKDYAIQDYPNLDQWLTGEFDITGNLSGQADFDVTPDHAKPSFKFQLDNLLYASGNLVMDNVNYAGVIDSVAPFHLQTEKPFTVTTIQVKGWTATDLSTEFEIGNRINISNTSLSALGGKLKIADISMSLEDLYMDSEIGVYDLQTEQILQWIPKVIGMAEGSISGVIPFQWDIKNSQFSLGRGHLQSPEGELGYMNLKIFHSEGEITDIVKDERYSMVDEALSNLQDSSLDIDILPPNSLTDDTRIRLNIKGFVDTRFLKAPVDVVRYYSLPIDSLTLTMEQVRQDLPGIRSSID
ncbi:MAG: YdbH domain-containing protein, partial [Verrucomicrobia bacterium]|nr:YdbH domain-containing protein [Verrucomicrobiota bacterium]